jgi:hypothetical protein
MQFVVVESPFASGTLAFLDGRVVELTRDDNIAYARACLHDCLTRHGEAPYASHLLYTQPGVLDDDVFAERRLGIQAGLEVGRLARLRLFYVDRGFSEGMRWGLKFAREIGQPCEIRRLGGMWELGWDSSFSLGLVRD